MRLKKEFRGICILVRVGEDNPGYSTMRIIYDKVSEIIDTVRIMGTCDMVDQMNNALKVLSNGKRGGLKVVAFDKSPFKLFTLRFSTKSVQAPSCKRPKTTQRTLFLSVEINNCFPITV